MTDKRHENLIPQAHALTVEEQSKGGKASGVARRNRKRVREVADVLLALPISKGDVTDLEQLQTISEDTNTDVITGILCNLIRQALDGSLRATQILFTMTGEYSNRYNIQADATVHRDESLERLEEILRRKGDPLIKPKTAEEMQTEEERNENTTLMFKYYCMREDGNQVAHNFTSAEQSKVQDLFNTADDELKVAFVRRCYGKDGKHLQTADCIALYDNAYMPRIKGI